MSTSSHRPPSPASAGNERAAGPASERRLDVSVVIPVRNEKDAIEPFFAELQETMYRDTRSYEVIFVDDGSTDRTTEVLRRIALSDPRCTVVEFARRFGPAAALNAGFRLARGEVIVAIEGDGQNDPHDIPALVAMLDQAPGYDVVSGWRKDAQGAWVDRRYSTRVANNLIRRLTWCGPIHDFGCMLRAYRRDVLADVHLYGESHVFLPAICRWRGARLGERIVNHRPRPPQPAPDGFKRAVKMLFDLLTVKFLGDYLTKPIYFFGKLSLATLTAALIAVALAVVQKLGYLTEHGKPVNLNNNVFILFAMMMFITAVMLLMMGVVSELLIRIYHESSGRPPYRIRRVLRFGETSAAGT